MTVSKKLYFMAYRFILEKYTGKNSRFTCPSCNTPRRFTKYIDTETGNYITELVGRCDRESSCGYHYTPKEYFADNQSISFKVQERPHHKPVQTNKQPSEVENFNSIPQEVLINTLSDYRKNDFVRFLQTRFGLKQIRTVVCKYLIGTWRDGRTVFWQVDERGKVRTGKLMLYDAGSGKRVKTRNPSWVHTELKNERTHGSVSYQPIKEKFRLSQCFFGEHLLSQANGQPVGVVESEKTAIVASLFLPKLIWIATGGCGNLNTNRLAKAVKGRQIIIFPDSSKYETWSAKIQAANRTYNLNIRVSDLLERRLTEDQKRCDYDLADFLLAGKFISK